MKKILELVVGAVALFGLALPLMSKARMAWAFYHLGYWIMTGLVTAWASVLFLFLKDLDWSAYKKRFMPLP